MKAEGKERWRQIINQDMEVSEAREKRGFAPQPMSEEELVAQKQGKGKGKGKKRKAKGADAQADATEVAALGDKAGEGADGGDKQSEWMD